MGRSFGVARGVRLYYMHTKLHTEIPPPSLAVLTSAQFCIASKQHSKLIGSFFTDESMDLFSF